MQTKDVVPHMTKGEFLNVITRGRRAGEGASPQERTASLQAWLREANDLRDACAVQGGWSHKTLEAFHIANETEDWGRGQDNDDDDDPMSVLGYGKRKQSRRFAHRSEQQRIHDILTLLDEVLFNGVFKTAPPPVKEHIEIATRILTIARDNPDKPLLLEDRLLKSPRLATHGQETIHACIGWLIDRDCVRYGHGGWLKVHVNQLKDELDGHKPQGATNSLTLIHSSIVGSAVAQGSNHVSQQVTGGMTVEQVTEALKAWLPEALKRIEADVGDASDKTELKDALEIISDEVEKPKTRLEMLWGALRTFTRATARVAGKATTEAVTKMAVAKLTHELSLG